MGIRNALTSVALMLACAATVSAQTAPAEAPPEQSAAASTGKVGVAVKVSTFGVGLDAAARLGRKANLRAGVNLFSYSRDFEDTDNNITWVGKLTLRSVHAYLDLFPFGGGFHISPGVVLNNGNKVSLSASITPGQKISIDDTDYVSSSTNPIQAGGNVSFKTAAPAVLIGWGNIIPTGRRFSVPFELGVVFVGAPRATITFTGTACAADGTNCRDMGEDASIQSDITAQQAELNSDIRIFRFHPVLSLGIGIRF